ncbi:MAG: beta-ketoacyl-[acyl-carrier-protein] synthase II, partial [Lachnospiraceae bacterium]|nr:beta-ketoacyl-[acyl-carrier-protein] synthase II [Lachnospiraceae bacterium]
MKKIVITGLGAVTPIGNDVNTYWDNLLKGECGIDKITKIDTEKLPVKIAGEIKDFDPLKFMTSKQVKEMHPFMQYGYAAAMQAIENAGEISENKNRIGITVGTALGGISPISEMQDLLTSGKKKRPGPRFIPQVIGNELAAQIAINKDYVGPSMTVSTACSSGGDAITLGCMLIETNQADAVICVGSESTLTETFISGLAAAHALSTNNDDPKHASRP